MSAPKRAISNPTFKALVRIVTFVLFGSLIGLGVVALAAGDHPTDLQREFAATCRLGFQMSLGAIIGLMGGKAATPESDR